MATRFSAGEADVSIGPDFSGFVRELRADLDSVEAELGVEIHPDFTEFARELQAYLERVNADLDVKIHADFSEFEGELDTRLQAISRAVEVRVGVDEVSLDAVETLIRGRLAAMDLRVDVQVGADTRTAVDDLALLTASYREMTMRVDADTSRAATQIAALNAVPVTANVRANTDSARSMLGGLLTNPLVLNVGAVGLAQVPALGTAVASIGADMQALTQNAALLPGFFAAAGAAGATLAVGLNGMKDAFKDGKAGQEAYEGLSREGRTLVDLAKSYGTQWDRIGDRIQGITLGNLTGPLDHMLQAQLPAIDRGMGLLAGEFNTGFRTILGELGSERAVGAVDTVFRNTAASAGILNGAIAPVISGLFTLTDAGTDKMPRLAQSFTDAATRFDQFLTRSDQAGDLDRWMNEGIEAGGRLLSVLGNLGSMLSSVLNAGKLGGEGFLATTDRLTERWAGWLKSTEGQEKLTTFFVQGQEQLDRWVPVLQSVGTILKSVYEAAQAWSAILMPFLSGAASLLANHEGLVKTLLVSYLAFRTIGPIFSALQSSIAGANTRLDTFRNGMAASSSASTFGRALGGIGAMIGPQGLITLGVGVAAAGIGILAQRHAQAARAAEEQRAKLEALGRTLDETTGKATAATLSTAAEQFGKEGFLTRAGTLGVSREAFVRASTGVDPAARDQINDRLTQIILEQRDATPETANTFGRARASGLSDTEIAQALQGLPEAVKKYREGIDKAQAALAAQGSEEVLPDLAQLKAAYNDVGESAATLGGKMNETSESMSRQGNETVQATDAARGLFELTQQGRDAFASYGVEVDRVTANTVVLKSATAEQQDRMRELGYTVEQLPDKTVKVTLNDEQARAQLVKIEQEATRPVTKQIMLRVQQGIDSPAVRENADTYSPESGYVHYAKGGPIEGGIPGRDSVPLLGMPGEHMLDTTDVDRLGGQQGVYRFRAALKAGLVQPMAQGGAVKPWGEKDDIDLAQAQNAVTQAEERLRALDFKKNVSPSERRGAELAVQEAQLKVRQLEDRKAGRSGSSGPSSEVLPQQALPGRRSDDELEREDADASVDQANTKRNQIYADPNATAEEKAAADRDYQRAQNQRAQKLRSLQSSKSGSGSGTSDVDISLPGIAAKGAGILAEGILAMFGLENSILSGGNVYTRSLSTAINFYAGGKAGQDEPGQPTDSEGYDYTPKNLPVDKKGSESGTSSSSSGTGEQGAANPEYNPGGGVQQWSPTFASVLSALAMPASWLSLGLAQMQSESGGNPRAINNWDSNAKKGTPSKGLMQVIDPTFASYRSELYPSDIWHPSANIAAALRYTVARYGTPVGVWGQGHGYRDGGWVFGPGTTTSDSIPAPWLSNKEFVVSAGPAETWGPQLEAINAGLPMPLPPLPAGMTPRGGDSRTVNRDHGVHFHAPVTVTDMGELVREQDRWSALQAQGAMAGLPG
ncbi:transglycosylase SLT domain-containing protein [Nocardia brasiliensis]|uniref:transglycosylase SLT domain-containing protein n=1 Tax=Nocardia brasiliensis TaxID=37326 RepID=UPI0037A67CAB